LRYQADIFGFLDQLNWRSLMDGSAAASRTVPFEEPDDKSKSDSEPIANGVDSASWKKVLFYAYSLVHDWTEAEDLTQETFVVLFREQKAGRPVKQFSAWMHTVTKHLAYRSFRKLRPDLHMSLDALEHDMDHVPRELADTRSLPEQRSIDESVLRLTAKVLSEFSEHDRECILMYLSGYSFQQIGSALGIPPWRARRLTLKAFHRFQARINRPR
jgi:RNA polymerase sigma factor (sigma-70 family)